MSEEIEDAALNVPRAIITTILLNGALGFGMLLALLFCLGDIDTALVIITHLPPHLLLTKHIGFTNGIPLHPDLCARNRQRGGQHRHGRRSDDPRRLRNNRFRRIRE
jgi:hypothetical protein